MFGEISVDSPSTAPTFLQDWSINRKTRELKKWLEYNFVQERDFFYDFSDWENEDELEGHEDLEALDTGSVIRDVWRTNLTQEELSYIINEIDGDDSKSWKPEESRINLEEDFDREEENEVPTLASIQADIPVVLRTLNNIEGYLPPALGHNGPPDGSEMLSSDIIAMRKLVERVSALTEVDVQKEIDLLEELSSRSAGLGGRVLKYIGNKGDLLLDETTKAAGKQLGTWGTRGLVLVLASDTLIGFADKILRLLSAL